MAAKQQVPANRVYEDIDPQTEWAREQDRDTLILVLPGFKREQLKVQVTSTRILRVSGECCVDNNKWRRFEKEFPIASNIDNESITANYEGGMLYIKHPKAIATTLTGSRDQAKPTVEAPRPQPRRPTQKSDQQPPAESPRFQQMDQPRPTQKSAQQPPAAAPRPQQQVTQKSAQEQAAQQVSSKSPNADKQTEGKTTAQAQANAQKTSPKEEKEGNEISEAKKDSRKTPVPEMEKELPSEHANKKQSTSSPDSDNVSQKTGAKETAGSSEKAGKVAGPSEKQKTHRDAEKKDKRPMTENDEQEGYREWVYSLAMELKKPKKLMNLIVAALLVVVFVLYAKHAAKQPIKELESKLP